MIERRNRSAPHLFREIDMKLFVAGVSRKTAPAEVREQLAVTPSHLVDAAEVLKLFGYNIDDLEGLARRGEKLNAEDERLSVEQRKNRWMPDAFATSSNLLSTAA